jgi:hypothetical protein
MVNSKSYNLASTTKGFFRSTTNTTTISRSSHKFVVLIGRQPVSLASVPGTVSAREVRMFLLTLVRPADNIAPFLRVVVFQKMILVILGAIVTNEAHITTCSGAVLVFPQRKMIMRFSLSTLPATTQIVPWIEHGFFPGSMILSVTTIETRGACVTTPSGTVSAFE